MSTFYKIMIIMIIWGCSEQQNDVSTPSSHISGISHSRGENSSGSLLRAFIERMSLNVLENEIIELPNHLTVLEKHNFNFGDEILKAEGKTLDYYLSWVGCFQDMKYAGTGLYHPVEIGKTITMISKLDGSIPSLLSECAQNQPKIETSSITGDKEFALSDAQQKGKLFFDVYLGRQTYGKLEEKIIASNTTSDERPKCHLLPLCEAHYLAGLTEGPRCMLFSESKIKNHKKYSEFPYLKDGTSSEDRDIKIVHDPSLACKVADGTQ